MMFWTNPYRSLEKALGYRFWRNKFLAKALTHPSFRHENEDVKKDNQRLEFLGDAVLGMMTAVYLFKQNPHMDEGEMTRLRSSITSTRALAEIAEDLEIGRYLMLGRGEQLTGGSNKTSNLADALEAILGAAYIDGGCQAVRKIFRNVFLPRLSDCMEVDYIENPKGKLQETCQRKWKINPRYRLLQEQGPSHDKTYTMNVYLNEHIVGSGTAANKKEAERQAAIMAIERIRRNGLDLMSELLRQDVQDALPESAEEEARNRADDDDKETTEP